MSNDRLLGCLRMCPCVYAEHVLLSLLMSHSSLQHKVYYLGRRDGVCYSDIVLN